MTKQFFFISSILFFIVSNINAQQRFEIGIEGGPSKCFYSIEETQINLKNTSNTSGFGGINFRYNSKSKFFGEVGIVATEYTEGLKLKQQLGYITSNHDEVILIPFRFGRPFSITKNFFFVPSIGIAPAIKTLSQDGSNMSYKEVNSGSDSRYEYEFRGLGRDVFFLMNGNALLEWKFIKNMKVIAGINYYQGISKITIADIRYQINNEPEQTGLLIGKGSFIGYSFGLKYLIK